VLYVSRDKSNIPIPNIGFRPTDAPSRDQPPHDPENQWMAPTPKGVGE